MLRITVEIQGEKVLDRALSRFGEQLRDLRQLWPAVVTELRAITREQFAGQGIGATGQWAKLSPAYKRWKEKNYPGRPILVRTEALKDSLLKNNKNTVYRPLPQSLEFGTKIKYAAYHQRGSGKLKRRPIFDLNEQQKTRIIKAIQKRLVSAGRDNGVTLK